MTLAYFLVGLVAWGYFIDWNLYLVLAYVLLFVAIYIPGGVQKRRLRRDAQPKKAKTYPQKLSGLVSSDPEVFSACFLKAVEFERLREKESDTQPDAETLQAIQLIIRESSRDKDSLILALKASFSEYEDRVPSERWLDFFIEKLIGVNLSSDGSVNKDSLIESAELIKQSIDIASGEEKERLNKLLKDIETKIS